MDINKKVSVINRSNSTVAYSLPELNIRREFVPGEEKRVPFNELEALSFKPGGPRLIWDYLFIQDEEAVEALSVRTEPEYWLNGEKIKDLLLNGTLDAFLDCLDFAPSGVIDLVKKYAFELPLNDNAKREALKKATGFDVSRALELKRQEEQVLAEEGMNKEAPTKQRRVQPKEEQSGRRTSPKYKIIGDIKEE